MGKYVYQADGSYGVVEASWMLDDLDIMYNLTVDEAHTYFVGDGQWLVHNDDCLFSPRVEAWLSQYKGRIGDLDQNIVNELDGGLSNLAGSTNQYRNEPEITQSDIVGPYGRQVVENLRLNLALSIDTTLRTNIQRSSKSAKPFESIIRQLSLPRYRFLGLPEMELERSILFEALSDPMVNASASEVGLYNMSDTLVGRVEDNIARLR